MRQRVFHPPRRDRDGIGQPAGDEIVQALVFIQRVEPVGPAAAIDDPPVRPATDDQIGTARYVQILRVAAINHGRAVACLDPRQSARGFDDVNIGRYPEVRTAESRGAGLHRDNETGLRQREGDRDIGIGRAGIEPARIIGRRWGWRRWRGRWRRRGAEARQRSPPGAEDRAAEDVVLEGLAACPPQRILEPGKGRPVSEQRSRDAGAAIGGAGQQRAGVELQGLGVERRIAECRVGRAARGADSEAPVPAGDREIEPDRRDRAKSDRQIAGEISGRAARRNDIGGRGAADQLVAHDPARRQIDRRGASDDMRARIGIGARYRIVLRVLIAGPGDIVAKPTRFDQLLGRRVEDKIVVGPSAARTGDLTVRLNRDIGAGAAQLLVVASHHKNCIGELRAARSAGGDRRQSVERIGIAATRQIGAEIGKEGRDRRGEIIV